MNRFVRKLLGFVVLPFLLLEMVVRVGGEWYMPSHHPWYKEANAKAKTEKIDFIFIGASRVRSSIDENFFGELMQQCLNRKVMALNLGHYGATMQLHFLALRQLQQANPENFKGCTVFLEAPSGLPYAEKWADDNWEQRGHLYLLPPFLSFSDIGTLWMVSTYVWQDKTYITLAWASKAINDLALARVWVDAKIEGVIKEQVHKILVGIFSIPLPKAPLKLDYEEAAALQNDAGAAERGRQAAIAISQEDIKNQQPIDDWGKTVLWDMMRFIKSSGGTLVIYSMPVSSFYERAYNTPLRQVDKKAFITKSAIDQLPYLTVPFDKTDDDFPDSIHLRSSLTRKFTAALANAYLSSIGKDNIQQVTRAEP
jgi:hypothetical protein